MILLPDEYLPRASSLWTHHFTTYYTHLCPHILSHTLYDLSLPLSVSLSSPSLFVNTITSAFLELARCASGLHSGSCLLGAGWITVGCSLCMSSQTSGRHCLGNQPNFPRKYIPHSTTLNFPYLSSTPLSFQKKTLTYWANVCYQSWTPPVLSSGMHTLLGFFVLSFFFFAKVEEIQLFHQWLTLLLVLFVLFSLRKYVLFFCYANLLYVCSS